MFNYEKANLVMLDQLFSWNDQQGRHVEFTVTRVQQKWIVFFYGCDEEGNQSPIAKFSGPSQDALAGWAKGLIRRHERWSQLHAAGKKEDAGEE